MALGWRGGHKTIKSAEEKLPFKPNEAEAIISGIDWRCLAARPTTRTGRGGGGGGGGGGSERPHTPLIPYLI